MRVEFKLERDWREFYRRLGFQIPDRPPNDRGWINFPCPLPTHPGPDRGEHGGINVYTGVYKCWHSQCQDEYQSIFNLKGPYLTPRQVLLLLGVEEPEATQAVEDFRLSQLLTEQVEPSQFHHDTFIREYVPRPGLWEFVQEAKRRLTPDLPIVQEYLQSRGLEFETLQDFDVGYVPEDPDEGQVECLVFPYFDIDKTEVLGLRGRTITGAKGGLKDSLATLYNLPSLQESQGVAILVEGETDCLRLYQALKRHGIKVPVLGVPGAFFKSEWVRFFTGIQRIIFIPQADRPSRKLARQIRRELSGKNVEIVPLPFGRGDYGKDIADFFRTHPEEDLLGLLNLEGPGKVLLEWEDIVTLAQRPVQWVIPGLIERGTVTILFGPPKKARKTWLALQLARSAVLCDPYLGVEGWVPESPQTVVLIEEEGSRERLAQRWLKVFQDESPTGGLYWIHRLRVLLDDPDSVTDLIELLRPIGPDLIILDPLAELHLQDENQVQGVRVVFEGVRALMQAFPQAALVLLHHPSKSGTGMAGLRGSSALSGMADLIIEVIPDPQDQYMSTLKIIGRDLEGESSVAIRFDPATGLHQVVSSVMVQVGDLKARLRQALEEAPEGLTVQELAEKLGVKPWKVRKALRGEPWVERDTPSQRNRPTRYRLKTQS